MNKKRYRENNTYNIDISKKNKSNLVEINENANINVKNMIINILDRITLLEKALKGANDKINELQQQNIYYINRLYKVYDYIGLHTNISYAHINSYIS